MHVLDLQYKLFTFAFNLLAIVTTHFILRKFNVSQLCFPILFFWYHKPFHTPDKNSSFNLVVSIIITISGICVSWCRLRENVLTYILCLCLRRRCIPQMGHPSLQHWCVATSVVYSRKIAVHIDDELDHSSLSKTLDIIGHRVCFIKARL